MGGEFTLRGGNKAKTLNNESVPRTKCSLHVPVDS